MTKQEYWDQCINLSRVSGEKYTALCEFLKKQRTFPIGEKKAEHDRLVSEYAAAFEDWISFTEEHKGDAGQ